MNGARNTDISCLWGIHWLCWPRTLDLPHSGCERGWRGLLVFDSSRSMQQPSQSAGRASGKYVDGAKSRARAQLDRRPRHFGAHTPYPPMSVSAIKRPTNYPYNEQQPLGQERCLEIRGPVFAFEPFQGCLPWFWHCRRSVFSLRCIREVGVEEGRPRPPLDGIYCIRNDIH